jgi:DNA uptake protein ComE-like DNA-binding protein
MGFGCQPKHKILMVNMASGRRAKIFTICCLTVLGVGLSGCAPNETEQQRKERENRTRDEAAKATERAKPEIQAAGRELGRAAEQAAREARAFAEGVRQGWISAGHHVVNINSASESELMELPNISRAEARKIIRGRPYHDSQELITKHVVSDDEYAKIKDIVTVQ